MPLINSLPLAMSGTWSATTPQQTLELITVFDTEEILALQSPPDAAIAWADCGTHTSVATGIVKVVHSMPQTGAMQEFVDGNSRKYHSIDVIAKQIKVSGRELSYQIPMIWDNIGNGYKLMSQAPDGSLIDFAGINGLAAGYVMSGRVEKARYAANLFYTSLYATTGGLSLTNPKQTTFPQGDSLNGIALFTDGTGAPGSVGDMHYSNPTVRTSGRFKNVWFGFGPFLDSYGASLVKMASKPHALFPDITSGATVTDTFGGTGMLENMWRMAVQTLVLQAVQVGGNSAAAAVTNPFSYAATMGITRENFIGTKFGPRTFWHVPQLDNHPYLAQNPSADFWINVSRGPEQASWAKLACHSKSWTPIFHMYGPGDPQAQRDRMMRWEGDLDGGSEPGDPMRVDMFGSL